MARPKIYRKYEDFLVDAGNYFSELNFAAYLGSLTPNEIIKDKKRISLLVGQEVTQENIKDIAEGKRANAKLLYDSLSVKMRTSKSLPPVRLMVDFGLSELEAMILLYLSWQDMMTDQVYLYTRTITHLLRMLIGSERGALSNLRHFGAESRLMQSGLVYLDRHNNSPIGSSDLIVIDEVQESLTNMADYNLDKIKRKRIHGGGKGTSQGQQSDFNISEPTGITLILPEETSKQLKLVETYVTHKDKIMKEWGMENSITYGSAMAILFYGPPGTGKTLSARFLASQTNKQLIVADYAEIMNKYVGETEKKIKGLFTKAQNSNAILLIDEVDSLVYGRKDDSKSWEVSHVNVTLQAIESFDGIVIFTTNREDLLDKALERRILIRVEFKTPDERERELIWRSMFTGNSALSDGVDFSGVAKKYNYSGGCIKNAALMAALKAAERGHERIEQEDILDAASLEFAKIKTKFKLGFATEKDGEY